MLSCWMKDEPSHSQSETPLCREIWLKCCTRRMYTEQNEIMPTAVANSMTLYLTFTAVRVFSWRIPLWHKVHVMNLRGNWCLRTETPTKPHCSIYWNNRQKANRTKKTRNAARKNYAWGEGLQIGACACACVRSVVVGVMCTKLHICHVVCNEPVLYYNTASIALMSL